MQGIPVVKSKLISPQLPGSLLLSKRITKLGRAIFDSRATTVTAPAGYGKTTLLAAALALAGSQDHRVCWYRLEQEDRDLTVFYAHLAETLFPGEDEAWIGTRASLERYGNTPEPHRYAAAVICQELWAWQECHSTQKTFIVLDDFQHAAGSPEITSAVEYLINNLPVNCSVIVSSRTETGLLAGRQRLQQNMLEIGREDLLFSAAELTRLLQEIYGIAAAPELVQQIICTTEGWIAGIIITCQVLVRHTTSEATGIIKRAGQKALLFNYLAAEVLKTTGSDLIMWLVKAAVLSDFTIAEASSILEEPNTPDLLAQCEQKGLFIQKTPGPETTYRFHPLFREALLQAQPAHLPAAAVSRYHVRAASHYIGQQLFSRAIEHFIASGNVDLAVDLVTQESMKMITFEAVEQLRLWFKLLPEAVVNDNGRLLYIKSFLYTHNWDDEMVPLLQRALAKFQEQNDIVMQMYTLSLMSHIFAVRNDVRSLIRCLNQLPRQLKETNDPYLKKCMAVLDFFRALWEEKYDKALSLCNRIRRLDLDDDWRWIALTYSCILHNLLGELDQAASFATEVLQLNLMQRTVIFKGFALAFYAVTLSLKDDRAAFPQVRDELIAVGERFGYLYLLGIARRLTAMERYSEHDLAGALEQIDASSNCFVQLGNTAMASLNKLSRCLWLAGGPDSGPLLAEARSAFRFLSTNRSGQCLREIGLSLLGAVARETGEYGFAEQCLLGSIAGSKAKNARQVLCGTMMHLAKLYWDTGNEARGREVLGQAMGIAADKGYVSFWDLHLPTLVETSARCIREQIGPDYALELVARYYGTPAADDLAANAPVAAEACLQDMAAVFLARYGGGIEAPTIIPAPKISVCLLGQFTVTVNGATIPETAWKTRKIAGVLKYLMLHRNQIVTRDHLMGLFWPNSDQKAASMSLRSALHELRKVLAWYDAPVAGDAALISEQRGGLEIKTGGGLSVDVDEFISLYRELDHTSASGAGRDGMAGDGDANQAKTAVLEKMIALYQGDLLKEDAYLDWAFEAREELKSLFLEASLSLVSIYLARGEYNKAEGQLLRTLDIDRYNEEACLHLLNLYTSINQRGRAAKLYADFASRLRKELDIKPDARLAAAVSISGA
ncbi:MAG: BTAD domain-containing putative transcriptional regulator [Thermacetogeniaceae bacterium]